MVMPMTGVASVSVPRCTMTSRFFSPSALRPCVDLATTSCSSCA
jgi:hypothetical protein